MSIGNVNKKKRRRKKNISIEMSETKGYLHNEEKTFVEEDEDEVDQEEINRQLWKTICDSLDLTCFYVFLFIAIFAPILVVAMLDHKMMGV